MWRKLIILIALEGCLAENSPSQAPPGLYCSYTPDALYSCIGNPTLFSRGGKSKCHHSSECDRLKCIFTEAGWMDGTRINKKNISDHFDQYAIDKPAWSPAVTHLKAACLGDHDVPAQGVYLGCPAYDITHCILISFIRNATPSQWKNTEDCRYPRLYASGCPICPSDCFGQQVPYGSCNACMSLPRSA